MKSVSAEARPTGYYCMRIWIAQMRTNGNGSLFRSILRYSDFGQHSFVFKTRSIKRQPIVEGGRGWTLTD